MKKTISSLSLLTLVPILAGCATPGGTPNTSMYSGSLNSDSAYSAPKMAAEGQSLAPEQIIDPQKMNTEEYSRIYENSFLEAVKNPLSTFSIDVDTASYSNIRRFINNQTVPPKDAVRIEEMINYFTYDYPQPQGNDPFSINMELSDSPWKKENKLVSIGLQGKKIEQGNIPAGNLVFLVDTSGSMNQPDKLPLLKESFKLLVNKLRPEDRISIVAYAGSAGVVLPSTAGNEKVKILNSLDKLSAGGSTAGGAGIELAYKIAKDNFIKSGNNRVILATDGDFNVGVSSDSELIRMIEEKRQQGTFLSVLGFGTGNYKDSKMEQLADKGNGNYGYIDTIKEAEKLLITQMSGTLTAIAKDVKLQIEFNPAKVKAYRLIGYENRVLKNEDFNDDKKDAGELGAGHTVTALYEITPVGAATEVSPVDKLKYSETVVKEESMQSNEMMTVKFRYKEPDGDISKLISKSIDDKSMDFSQTSDNFRFSAAVAGFGLLIRDSQYKGNISFQNVIDLAGKAKGSDKEGYRTEFINLVQSYNSEK